MEKPTLFAFMCHFYAVPKNLYRMLVMCLKLYKSVISKEDGFKGISVQSYV